MKFLTIRQPWAQLIAVGAKTIETRPFSTKYRGPLAIHAGKANDLAASAVLDVVLHDRGLGCFADDEWTHPPLGAVVAVCDLIDVVPICEMADAPTGATAVVRPADDEPILMCLSHDGLGFAWRVRRNLSDQLPFGDFTPGRFAWMLDNVRLIDPVPMKGAQGLRDLPEGVVLP